MSVLIYLGRATDRKLGNTRLCAIANASAAPVARGTRTKTGGTIIQNIYFFNLVKRVDHSFSLDDPTCPSLSLAKWHMCLGHLCFIFLTGKNLGEAPTVEFYKYICISYKCRWFGPSSFHLRRDELASAELHAELARLSICE
jgi:hypothetical protein